MRDAKSYAARNIRLRQRQRDGRTTQLRDATLRSHEGQRDDCKKVEPLRRQRKNICSKVQVIW